MTHIVVLFRFLALLERMLQLLWYVRLTFFSRGFKVRMPINRVFTFAMVVVAAIVFPVLRELEACALQKSLGLVLFNRPSIFPAEILHTYKDSCGPYPTTHSI